jgi:NAD(P)-dependent dehydrogenase (short-subunit alcohol dehydrogenase family)
MGEEIARELARRNCKVALVSWCKEELMAVADSLNAVTPGIAFPYVHDVRSFECAPSLFQQITHDLGGLDVVFYMAGVMPRLQPDEYDFDQDKKTIEVNTLGAIAWLNEAAQRFQRAREGTIVGISSVAGDRGRRGMPAYAASKAALTCYLEALRNRLSQHGVSVVTIKPGPVDTPLTRGSKQPLIIPASKAATLILKAARRRGKTVYVPGIWRYIMFIVRNIPSAIFTRMKF